MFVALLYGLGWPAPRPGPSPGDPCELGYNRGTEQAEEVATGGPVAVRHRKKETDVYPELLIAPMREELTRLGVKELRTAADVDRFLTQSEGTVMVVVNSVCGCAAGKARPGVALALGHAVKPSVVATVFAGTDVDATERARSYFTGYAPSSPSIALLRGGKLLYMMERREIENQAADAIASQLAAAFDKYCATEPASA